MSCWKGQENKANQSQTRALGRKLEALSSKRSKKARVKRKNAKQSQFAEWPNERKLIGKKWLWRFMLLEGPRKQSQFFWIPVFTGMTVATGL